MDKLKIAILTIILLSAAGMFAAYSHLLFRQLNKIQKKLGDRVFYWLINDKE